jgi:hypothetical protein
VASEVLFARYKPKTLEPKNSMGAKWLRLLDRLELASAVEGRRTAVKMHLGGGTGFTTVHPFFVRKLVQKLRDAGAKEVFVTDGPSGAGRALDRGYSQDALGCPVVSATGTQDRYFYDRSVEPPFETLRKVELSGEIVDAEAMIDLSHVKGHGDCGFGGASKNLSMGCVTQATRRDLHALEGGLIWDDQKCDHCRICMENCPNGAISFREERFSVFWHHCKLCQHCALICPRDAITVEGGKYKDFQKGMAIATSMVLDTFEPGTVVFVNFLTNITIFCDCWGMTTPQIVPDVGVLAGRDIVAVERASLDLIRPEDLIPGSLPEGWPLTDEGHLFERIHRKAPYVVVDCLAEMGKGSREYALAEVE